MPPPPISSNHHRLLFFLHTRSFIDARIHWVRDRALDHAVEKEKHLLPFHSLKDFLLNSSSSSLSLDTISSNHQNLLLPFRAIRFIRLFPSAFIEQPPNPSSSSSSRPFIRPTENLIQIHSEELRAFESSRSNAADRLLRLLMISPHRKLPLSLIDRLRFDLGLPFDFVRALLPDFPDYFQVSPSSRDGNSLDIELVCYRKDLAVSAMEDYAMRTGGYNKGASLAFPLRFSRGFELEKKVRKWVDEWQKLPYVSPYESGSNLPSKSDVKEKWVVGVLHEVLSLLIGKKTEIENLVLLGRLLGLPAGFRKVILHHPGIFYLSNKLRRQTVVLREAYRRDLLIEKHPMMGIRYRYIHLMRMSRSIGEKKKKKKDRSSAEAGGREEEGEDEEDGDYEQLPEFSDFESEDEESDDDGDGIRDEEIQGRRLSTIRASGIERELITRKTRGNDTMGSGRFGSRKSKGTNGRMPPKSRISA